MTVPKFRAWDIHEKKMITNEQIIIWNNNVYANDGGKLKPDRLMGWNIDDKYLMQSTGLKDRNGIEIFEGDIVEYSLPLGYSGKGEVIFDEEYGWFNIDGFYAGIYDYPTLAFSEGTDNFEVIGNVHQHQLLLEELNGG